MSRKERKALHVLQQSKDLNFKKADKGKTLVVMDKNDKIQESQVQINDLDNYKPLNKPIVKETHTEVSRVISKLHRGNYLDDMTKIHQIQIHRGFRNSIPLKRSTNLL